MDVWIVILFIVIFVLTYLVIHQGFSIDVLKMRDDELATQLDELRKEKNSHG